MTIMVDQIRSEVEALNEAGHRQPYLLYAMGLRLRTLDYEGLQEDSLLDGGDDKKIDFFSLDLDLGTATVAQSYIAQDWSRAEAPANKASDLNTALNWLLEKTWRASPEKMSRRRRRSCVMG